VRRGHYQHCPLSIVQLLGTRSKRVLSCALVNLRVDVCMYKTWPSKNTHVGRDDIAFHIHVGDQSAKQDGEQPQRVCGFLMGPQHKRLCLKCQKKKKKKKTGVREAGVP
jgi:hypothetical protein